MKEEQDIEQLFRSSFDDFEVTPPPGVRDAIAQRIGSNVPWYRKPWMFITVAVVAVVATAVFFLFGNQSDSADGKPALAQNEYNASGESNNAKTSNSQKSNEASETSTNNSGNTNGGGQNASSSSNPDTRNTSNSTDKSSSADQGKGNATKSGSTSGSGQQSSTKNNSSKQGNNTRNRGNGNGGSSIPAGKPVKLTKAQIAELKKENDAALLELIRIERELKALGIAPDPKINEFSTASSKDPQQLAEEIRQKTEVLLAELASSQDEARKAAIAKADKARQDSLNQVQTQAALEAKNKAQKDSTDKANEAKNEVAEQKPTPPPAKKDNGSYNWKASFYGAILPVMDKSTYAENFAGEVWSMRYMSAEIQRIIGGKWTMATGVSYSTKRENFVESGTTWESYFVGVDSIPIYQGDTIIDWEPYDNYDTTYTPWSLNYAKSTQSFGIPLFVGRSFDFGGNWGADLQLGTVINFYKVTSTGDVETTLPTYTKTGVQGYLRLNGTYTWNRFVFSGGIYGGYDFKPSVIYGDYRRKLYYLGPQLGVHFKF